MDGLSCFSWTILRCASFYFCFTPCWPPSRWFLINGYQTPPCENAQSRDTFGQLEDRLKAMGREVSG